MPRFRLRDLSRDAKLLVTAFLTTLSLGYASGLAYVFMTTEMRPGGVAAHYAGSEDEQEMKFAKSPLELAQTTHNHVLSISLLFAVLGAFLLCVEMPARARRFLILEGFVSIVTTFASLWLVRYVSPLFSWLMLLSGIGMAATFFASVAVVLRETWSRGDDRG
jgi:hypothetical protein